MPRCVEGWDPAPRGASRTNDTKNGMGAKQAKTVTASTGMDAGALKTTINARHHRFGIGEAPPAYDSTDAHPDPYDCILPGHDRRGTSRERSLSTAICPTGTSESDEGWELRRLQEHRDRHADHHRGSTLMSRCPDRATRLMTMACTGDVNRNGTQNRKTEHDGCRKGCQLRL